MIYVRRQRWGLHETGRSFAADVEVIAVRWSDASSGRAIVITRADNGEEVTVAGQLGFARPGDRARVGGRWTKHARFGSQVQATAAAPLDPTGERARASPAAIGRPRRGQLPPAVGGHGLRVLDLMDGNALATVTALPRMPADRARGRRHVA